jgi:hypothetical protein
MQSKCSSARELPLPCLMHLLHRSQLPLPQDLPCLRQGHLLLPSGPEPPADSATPSAAAAWRQVEVRGCRHAIRLLWAGVDNLTPFVSHLYVQTINLPRQARDKHRKS